MVSRSELPGRAGVSSSYPPGILVPRSPCPVSNTRVPFAPASTGSNAASSPVSPLPSYPVKPIRFAARSCPGSSRRSSRTTPMPGRFSASTALPVAMSTPRARYSNWSTLPSARFLRDISGTSSDTGRPSRSRSAAALDITSLAEIFDGSAYT